MEMGFRSVEWDSDQKHGDGIQKNFFNSRLEGWCSALLYNVLAVFRKTPSLWPGWARLETRDPSVSPKVSYGPHISGGYKLKY
jgi:hypothetical protein